MAVEKTVAEHFNDLESFTIATPELLKQREKLQKYRPFLSRWDPFPKSTRYNKWATEYGSDFIFVREKVDSNLLDTLLFELHDRIRQLDGGNRMNFNFYAVCVLPTDKDATAETLLRSIVVQLVNMQIEDPPNDRMIEEFGDGKMDLATFLQHVVAHLKTDTESGIIKEPRVHVLIYDIGAYNNQSEAKKFIEEMKKCQQLFLDIEQQDKASNSGAHRPRLKVLVAGSMVDTVRETAGLADSDIVVI
ncbi:hypothetical protein BDV96DRAFT_651933 [Lophiotrema nucula]|uniref:Uncharacterized protein n=1 Tax=Lophiotrema nucula TaxID=690887 RepID=A0A6A5YTN6_9PLEO|nr:hypothetical protein BDV96DRAFT_651933 [Lophiotrema nucula]